MIRFILKEASMLVAFIVLGGVLLLCLWITENFQKSFLHEFQNAKISLIFKEGTESQARQLFERDKNIIRYEFFNPDANKENLGELYPELRNVIAPLDTKFFPSSAIVTTTNADAVLTSLKSQADILDAQVLHRPPERMAKLLNGITIVFSVLWILTLTLVLYFNMERLALQKEPQWSLMKMLGARSWILFGPLLWGQMTRVFVAGWCAILLSTLIIHQIQAGFAWRFQPLSWQTWLGFSLIAPALTALIAFGLFQSKYRRISLG